MDARYGFLDATLTRRGPDEGVDVRATGAVAQVKARLPKIALAVNQPSRLLDALVG